jgi:hypothetical protein
MTLAGGAVLFRGLPSNCVMLFTDSLFTNNTEPGLSRDNGAKLWLPADKVGVAFAGNVASAERALELIGGALYDTPTLTDELVLTTTQDAAAAAFDECGHRQFHLLLGRWVGEQARLVLLRSEIGFAPEEDVTHVVLTGYPDVIPLFDPHLGRLRGNLHGGWDIGPANRERFIFELAAEATVKEANETLPDGGYVGGVIQSVLIERHRMMRRNAEVEPLTLALGSGASAPLLRAAWL